MKIESYALLDRIHRGLSPIEMVRSLIERLALFLSDLFALVLAFYFWFDFRAFAKLAGAPPILSVWMQAPTPSHFIAFFSAGALVMLWFWGSGHYSKRLPFWEELGQLLRIMLTGLMTEVGLLILLSNPRIDWRVILLTWFGVFLLVPTFRFGSKHLLLRCGLWRRNTIVVGLGQNGQAAYLAIRGEPLMGYDVKWFGRSRGDRLVPEGVVEVEGKTLPVIDLSQEPRVVLTTLGSPQIIVAVDGLAGQEGLVTELGATSRDVMVIPSLRGLPLQGVEVSHFFSREVLLLHVKNNLANSGARFVKRLFDIVGSTALLFVLAPVFFLIVFLIRRDGGAAIYGHTRIGADGEAFECLKFRSMVVDAERVLQELLERDPNARAEWAKDFKLKNDPRITRIGAFLRNTSLDELPQLINVLKGEMSLVGPRPVVREELPRYGDQVGYYLQVRPGITGLWQVSGRNDVSYATRVSLDVWYVKNWSLWTDIVVLLKTVRAVTSRMGAY